MADKIMLFYTKNRMRWLLFLSKLAFICNLLFIPAFILQIKNFIGDIDLSSYIIIIGFVFAILFNPVTNLCYLLLFFLDKKKLSIIPDQNNCQPTDEPHSLSAIIFINNISHDKHDGPKQYTASKIERI